jgi:hypothetical protein
VEKLMDPNQSPTDEKRSSSGGMRNVLALGLVSFFTDFSTEMVLGILPLFIVNNLGVSRTMLGSKRFSFNIGLLSIPGLFQFLSSTVLIELQLSCVYLQF